MHRAGSSFQRVVKLYQKAGGSSLIPRTFFNGGPPPPPTLHKYNDSPTELCDVSPKLYLSWLCKYAINFLLSADAICVDEIRNNARSLRLSFSSSVAPPIPASNPRKSMLVFFYVRNLTVTLCLILTRILGGT